MTHVEKCPICHGTGEKSGHVEPQYGTPIFQKREEYLRTHCHGCGGKGWIEVSD